MKNLAILLIVLTGLAFAQSRFSKSGNIITDRQTGLQWQVRDIGVGSDSRTNWNDAVAWAQSLGNGWRLPTRDELRSLNEAGITARSWGPFENNGSGGVWQGNLRDDDTAWGYCFSWESGFWNRLSEKNTVFAVRSP